MVGAIAATILAFCALTATWQQAIISQKALIESDRAWVKIVNLPEIKVNVTENTVIVSSTFSLKNIGHSPAQHTFIKSKILLASAVYEEIHEAKLQCDQSYKNYPTPFDALIFPDDEHEFRDFRTIGMQEIRDGKQADIRREFDTDLSRSGKTIAERTREETTSFPLRTGFILVGCITYTIPVAEAPGHTALIYHVNQVCDPPGTEWVCAFDMTQPREYSRGSVVVQDPIGGTSAW